MTAQMTPITTGLTRSAHAMAQRVRTAEAGCHRREAQAGLQPFYLSRLAVRGGAGRVCPRLGARQGPVPRGTRQVTPARVRQVELRARLPAALDADGGRRPGADHRLRERRQPAARAGHRPPPRDGGAAGARRHAAARRAPVAGRERAARARRWRRRTGAGDVGRAERCSRFSSSRTRRLTVTAWPDARVLAVNAPRLRRRRRAVWTGAGVAEHAARTSAPC